MQKIVCQRDTLFFLVIIYYFTVTFTKLSPKDFSYGTFFVTFVIPMDLGSSVK